MRSRWRTASLGGEQRTPVEMRFIDMFMTALGSLLFLAVLLSFLLINLPRTPQPGILAPQPIPISKLQIVTKELCPGRVDVPYHCALAYRGGTGQIVWKISLAEPPPDIRFDAEQGVFTGIPKAAASTRFVIEARDARGPAEPRDYELKVTAPAMSAQRVNMWIAGFLLVALLLYSLMAFGLATLHRQIANRAAEAWSFGNSSVEIPRGQHSTETIYLPEGIDFYNAASRGSLRMARITFLAALGVLGYVVWVVWW